MVDNVEDNDIESFHRDVIDDERVEHTWLATWSDFAIVYDARGDGNLFSRFPLENVIGR
jgi:hypothetical protein